MTKPLFILVYIFISAFYCSGQAIFELNQWIQPLPEKVIDIDSNVYHVQKIGSQIWLKENLRVTKFNNGSEIEFIQPDSRWVISDSPSYSRLIGIIQHSDGLDSIETNELLYNFYVVSDKQNVCPTGWKVPDTSDWKILEDYISKVNTIFVSATMGIPLSDIDTTNMEMLNLGAVYPPDADSTTNYEYNWDMIWSNNYNIGFTSSPFGFRSGTTGEFWYYNDYGYWWSTNPAFVAAAWARIQNRGFGIDDIHLEETRINKKTGYSIKCIKE